MAEMEDEKKGQEDSSWISSTPRGSDKSVAAKVSLEKPSDPSSTPISEEKRLRSDNNEGGFVNNGVEEITAKKEGDKKADEAAEGEPEAVVKLNRKQLALMTFAMICVIFLVALDETIISTAIPRITDQFHSINDIGWYGSGYMLTNCAFQLHYGKLYQNFSQKKVFLFSITVFELGSLICGVSPNSAVLIAGRAIAGTGAGGIVSGVLVIISKAVPLRERALYTAAVGSIYGVASLAGPLLGGLFTSSHLTWRWCFYINLPIGGFSAAVMWFLYRPPPEPPVESRTFVEKVKLLDPLGLFLFVPSMVCLFLALQFSAAGSWADARVIATLVLFVVFLVLFTASQIWLQEAATLPPRIARKKTIIFTSLYAMTLDASYFSLSYYLPIWFQGVKGVSASQSGIRSIPQIIAAFAMSIAAGIVVTKTGHYVPFMLAATVLASIGMGLLTTLNIESGAGEWIGYQVLAGMGVGLGMQQGVVVVQNGMDEKDIPIGISCVIFFQALGPALMVSVSQNIFSERLTTLLSQRVPGLSPQAVLKYGVTRIVDEVTLVDKHTVLLAINRALSETWYAGVAAAAVSGIGLLGIPWKRLVSEKKDD